MKIKLINLFFIFLFISSPSIISQYNWEKIYNADTCGIIAFKHFRVNYDSRQILYFQFNMSNQPIHSNQALYYSWCKLDNNSSAWVQRPHNSFLYSYPFYCPWPNVMAWRYYKVDNFMISATDPNLILETRDVPPCGIGFQEPIQDTRITYNGGTSTTTLPAFGNDLVGNECGGFDIDPVNDSIMYMVYNPGGSQKFVYKTINRGSKWIVTDTIPDVYPYGMLKVNPLRRNDIFIKSYNNLLKSSDGGLNFYSVGGASFSLLIFDRVDSSIFGFAQNQIYKSTTAGSTWNIISSIPSALVMIMEINPDNHNMLYAGNDSGLYISTNAGLNWILYNNSFYPSRRVIGLSKNNGSGDTLYAATTDAVYKVWGGFIAVGINPVSSEVPTAFKLYQNYPNPFNPVSKIMFNMPKSLFVTLKVYNAVGDEVAVLIDNEFKNPGIYSCTFDGSNLASGVYFYSLTAGTFNEKKKMVLIK